ncbi:hypothetical protein D3C71_1325100 [compost metagenome]
MASRRSLYLLESGIEIPNLLHLCTKVSDHIGKLSKYSTPCGYAAKDIARSCNKKAPPKMKPSTGLSS